MSGPKHSILLDKCPEMELMDRSPGICWALMGAAKPAQSRGSSVHSHCSVGSSSSLLSPELSAVIWSACHGAPLRFQFAFPASLVLASILCIYWPFCEARGWISLSLYVSACVSLSLCVYVWLCMPVCLSVCTCGVCVYMHVCLCAHTVVHG